MTSPNDFGVGKSPDDHHAQFIWNGGYITEG